MNKRTITLKPWMKTTWDCIVVTLGITLMVLSFLSPDSQICSLLSYPAGVLGVLYTFSILFLGIVSRPRFDWHLVNGNYILKVISIVLLVPFSLYLWVGCPNVNLQAEDLVESNQSEQSRIVDTLVIKHKDSLSIIVPLYTDVSSEDALTLNPTILSESASSPQEDLPLFWTVYYHFMDPGNQHMTTSPKGRNWAALIAILGVFLLNGLLVSSIIGWIDSRKEKWLKGDVKYKLLLSMKPHYVIIGSNDMVEGIVQQLFSKDNSGLEILNPYILIQTSQDVETFRQALFTNLTIEQQKRVIIYYGNLTSKVDIDDLCLRRAKEVYILGEDVRVDDIESYHDTMNMECLKLISENLADCRKFYKKADEDKRLVCRVMFEYQTSFNVFKVTDIDVDKIKFLPFNYYEKWAQNVLICQKTDPADIEKAPYLPLEGPNGIKIDDTAFVHVIIVGMSRMGIALAIESAHLAHYPNFDAKNKRTKITFVDINADVERDFFMTRFKALFSLSHWRYGAVIGNKIEWNADNEIKNYDHLGDDFIDVEWEFIKGSVQSSPVQQYIIDSSKNEDARLTIAICIPENSRAIATALYLPDSIYQSKSTLQVLVYQRLNDELVRQISENNGRYCHKIKPFGMAKACYDTDLVDLSESMEGAIGNAYDEYMWKRIVERFNSGGLTEDDYKKLTDYRYHSNLEKKQDVRNLCDEWIINHVGEEYSKVKEAKKELIDKIDTTFKTRRSGKTSSAKMWSNYYNIYSMWTKFRSVTTADGHAFNPLKEDFDGVDSEMMTVLGQIEHNRWNVEQLLLRFRPLTKEEQDEARIVSLNASDVRKEEYKTNFAHLDICSNEVLDSVDYNMSHLDKSLIKVLPSAYRQFKVRK